MEHSAEQMARLFGDGSNATNTSFDDRSSHYSSNASEKVSVADKGASGQMDWKAQKQEQALKRKKEAALKKCEDTIAELEARNDEINEEMAKPEIGTDLAKLRALSDEQQEITTKLEALYNEWEELSE